MSVPYPTPREAMPPRSPQIGAVNPFYPAFNAEPAFGGFGALPASTPAQAPFDFNVNNASMSNEALRQELSELRNTMNVQGHQHATAIEALTNEVKALRNTVDIQRHQLATLIQALGAGAANATPGHPAGNSQFAGIPQSIATPQSAAPDTAVAMNAFNVRASDDGEHIVEEADNDGQYPGDGWLHLDDY